MFRILSNQTEEWDAFGDDRLPIWCQSATMSYKPAAHGTDKIEIGCCLQVSHLGSY